MMAKVNPFPIHQPSGGRVMNMLRYHSEQLYSIASVAERFQITSRTLRLYHEMGLFCPSYIDGQTKYRYYSVNQFPRLEKILQMKSIGLSLKQIKSILDTRNLSVFEALLNEQIDSLDEKITELSASRDMLKKQLLSCAHLRNIPSLNTPFIEFIPKRAALSFAIQPYDLAQRFPSESPWEKAIGFVSQVLSENALPHTLLSQLCCSISAASLQREAFICDHAYIIGDNLPPVSPIRCTIQSGTYACIYRKYIAKDNLSEYQGVQALTGYIRDNHYQIVGPYYGEVVAEASVFDYIDNNILVKMQIPVKITD